MIKLDYNIKDVKDRIELVNKILAENPEPNEAYLEILSNYIIIPVEKEERKQRKILTENRMATVNKRETSFEGLVSQLENGEDGIYNLINDNKNTIFQPKVSITKKDLDEIPPLRDLREAITAWEKRLTKASGKEAYTIKRTIIELRKEQYIIKEAFRKPVVARNITRSRKIVNLDDSYEFDADGYVIPHGVSLCDPKVCSAILCNYNMLQGSCYGQFDGDLWYLIEDFNNLYEKALKDYPIYKRLTEDKIAGYQNIEIQEDLINEFGIKHSLEYISSLWRKKIPNLLASAAEDDLLYWHYFSVEKGKYKKCSKCGQIKLAHNKYFSKNKTSKDGFYSICKECRNKKTKENKDKSN